MSECDIALIDSADDMGPLYEFKCDFTTLDYVVDSIRQDRLLNISTYRIRIREYIGLPPPPMKAESPSLDGEISSRYGRSLSCISKAPLNLCIKWPSSLQKADFDKIDFTLPPEPPTEIVPMSINMNRFTRADDLFYIHAGVHLQLKNPMYTNYAVSQWCYEKVNWTSATSFFASYSLHSIGSPPQCQFLVQPLIEGVPSSYD